MTLNGLRFDFSVCLTAAMLFIQENQRLRYIDELRVLPGDTTGLPRLATERLYLES